MPSKNPRMLLTLTPELRAALDRFANATGVPAPTFVVSVLQDALPMIEQLAKAAEAQKEKRAGVVDMLLAPLAHAAGQLEQAQLNLHEVKRRGRPRKKAA